jgi:hypothetical protein
MRSPGERRPPRPRRRGPVRSTSPRTSGAGRRRPAPGRRCARSRRGSRNPRPGTEGRLVLSDAASTGGLQERGGPYPGDRPWSRHRRSPTVTLTSHVRSFRERRPPPVRSRADGAPAPQDPGRPGDRRRAGAPRPRPDPRPQREGHPRLHGIQRERAAVLSTIESEGGVPQADRAASEHGAQRRGSPRRGRPGARPARAGPPRHCQPGSGAAGISVHPPHRRCRRRTLSGAGALAQPASAASTAASRRTELRGSGPGAVGRGGSEQQRGLAAGPARWDARRVPSTCQTRHLPLAPSFPQAGRPRLRSGAASRIQS